MKKGSKAMKLFLATAITLVALAPFQAIAANKLIVKDSTGTVDKFVVTDTGAVGIGNNNPQTPLHIVGPSTVQSQIISQFVSATPPSGSPLSGGGGFIGYFNYPNSGLPKVGDRLGYFLFGAYDTDGTSSRNGAGLAARAEADWVTGLNGSTASLSAYLLFETAGSTGNRAERMRLTGAGNLGIGTTTPSQKIEVNGGVRLNTATAQLACDANLRGTVWFTQGATGVKDKLEVCAKDAGDAYAWRTLY